MQQLKQRFISKVEFLGSTSTSALQVVEHIGDVVGKSLRVVASGFGHSRHRTLHSGEVGAASLREGIECPAVLSDRTAEGVHRLFNVNNPARSARQFLHLVRERSNVIASTGSTVAKTFEVNPEALSDNTLCVHTRGRANERAVHVARCTRQVCNKVPRPG